MTSKNLKSTYKLVQDAAKNRHLGHAFTHLEALAMAASAPWEIRSELERLRTDYGYLTQYALQGVEDARRAELLASMASSVVRIADSVMRHVEKDDSPKLYFSTIRYEKMQSDSDIVGMMQNLMRLSSDLTSFEHGLKHESPDAALERRRTYDEACARLFRRIWTAFPLNRSEIQALEESFASPVFAEGFKEFLTESIYLGAMEYFDAGRLELLGKIYLSSTRPRIEFKALSGLLLSLWRHRNNPAVTLTPSPLSALFATLEEKATWKADVRTLFLEIARTRDTERLSRSMRDEVIPRLMKLRPDIMKKIDPKADRESIDSLIDSDFNPEWEEIFEQSGLGEKLRELNEQQSEGGDVMMGTFSSMKHYPFFNEVSNWFMPFSPEHSAVASSVGAKGEELARLLDMGGMMCDSDKYSLILSFSQVPEAARQTLFSQLHDADAQLAAIQAQSLNGERENRRNICNKHVQDLYRFYKLFRRKSEFPNPFEVPVNFAKLPFVSSDTFDAESLMLVGQFYFKRGYYPEALEIFEMLLDGDATAELFQKCGYCHQQEGRLEEALKCYQRSELMRPDSMWTLRRIASCLKLLGRATDALPYFEKIAKEAPDDSRASLNLGHCLLETGDYRGALKQYFKVEYLSANSRKALRPIAWCLFLTGDYDRSATYYKKIFLDNPTGSDYLNMGHLSMALREYGEAVNYYRLASENGCDIESALATDFPHLLAAGIASEMIDIVTDNALQ